MTGWDLGPWSLVKAAVALPTDVVVFLPLLTTGVPILGEKCI